MPQSSSRRQLSNCVFHHAQTAPRSPSNRAVGALRWGWNRTVNVQLTNQHNGRIFYHVSMGPNLRGVKGFSKLVWCESPFLVFKLGILFTRRKAMSLFFQPLHCILFCSYGLVVSGWYLNSFMFLFWKCFIAVFIVDNFPWRLIKYADS